MEKRHLGELEVSALGYGAMGLSHAYGAPLEKEEAVALLKTAFDAGYTMIDTAEVYGPYINEELVGEAFAGMRSKVQIATKCGIRLADYDKGMPLPDNSPEFIRKSLEGSLKRLKTDYIDLYYIHRIDERYTPEETAELMGSFIKEGKVRFWGISEADADYLERADRVCKVSAIQNRYSLLYRDYERLFPILERLNIGFVAFSPLGNGFLSAAYKKGEIFDPKTDYRHEMAQFKDEGFEQNAAVLELIRKLADKYQATPSQISMDYLLAKRPYVVPIPGSRHAERIKENALACEVKLDSSDLLAMTKALDSMGRLAVFGGHKAPKE